MSDYTTLLCATPAMMYGPLTWFACRWFARQSFKDGEEFASHPPSRVAMPFFFLNLFYPALVGGCLFGHLLPRQYETITTLPALFAVSLFVVALWAHWFFLHEAIQWATAAIRLEIQKAASDRLIAEQVSGTQPDLEKWVAVTLQTATAKITAGPQNATWPNILELHIAKSIAASVAGSPGPKSPDPAQPEATPVS